MSREPTPALFACRLCGDPYIVGSYDPCGGGVRHEWQPLPHTDRVVLFGKPEDIEQVRRSLAPRDSVAEPFCVGCAMGGPNNPNDPCEVHGARTSEALSPPVPFASAFYEANPSDEILEDRTRLLDEVCTWLETCGWKDAAETLHRRRAGFQLTKQRTKEAVPVTCGHPVAAQYRGPDGWRCGACPNEAQSGPLCPGCGWPRTPQQSHAESCPVARGDGARCHRCGHYETSYERAASLYAHCPSCSRHTRWERVPNDPRTDSPKDRLRCLGCGHFENEVAGTTCKHYGEEIGRPADRILREDMAKHDCTCPSSWGADYCDCYGCLAVPSPSNPNEKGNG